MKAHIVASVLAIGAMAMVSPASADETVTLRCRISTPRRRRVAPSPSVRG